MSDGERVFYNPRTKASAWTLPPDAVPQPAPAPLAAPPALPAPVPAPASVPASASAAPVPASVPVPVAVAVPVSVPVPAPAPAPVAKATAAEAAVGQKRALDEAPPAAAEKAPRSEADAAAAAEAAAVAEAARAAEERAREEEAGRREAFRALLREKKIGPLSHWDKELPRLAFDARFALLPRMADRRAEFDAFRMSRGEEERSAKIAAVQRVKEARAALAALLDAHVTSVQGAPRLSELRAQHAADAAFSGGLEAREVERMYNERIEALRRGDEAARQALHKRFVELLVERLRPDEAESWRSARRALGAADAAWDAPFGAISERRREELFEEYEREMRHRRHALRQREADARREREAVERDMERRRADLARDEALAALRAAMRERCRVVDMPWAEAARLLAGDARWESGALREAEKAEAYAAHQEALRAHLAGEYRAWLVEQTATGALPLGATFAATDARADRRFRPLPEAERAAVFERFAAALVAEARDDLVRLLRETRQLHRQVEARGDLDGVRRLLEKDARYVRLAALPAEREAAIAEYIRTQAPPPPQGGQLRAAIEAAEEELNPTMPRFSVAMVGQSEKELGL